MFNYYVIGGHFTSLNFHSFLKDTAVVRGPYKTRELAQIEWQELSQLYRHKACYRFIIVEEPIKSNSPA
jgi:hypothetical protein